MTVDKTLIQELRTLTGVGVMDAKKSLEKTDGDIDKAVELLKKQGQKVAAKKQSRATKEGVVGFYVHSNNKVASMVALACESDFVAKTDDFKALAHDLAMQVAAADPLYISPEDVPAEVIKKEKKIFEEQLRQGKKPEKIRDNIIKGKLEKFYAEVCLLKQPFIKEDKKIIEQLIQEKVLKLGENVQVKEFKRMSL